MYDGSILNDVVHDVIDIKRDNEVLKHQQIRSYIWIVAVVIIAYFMFKKKRK